MVYLVLWGLSFLSGSVAQAYYDSGYSHYYPSFRSQQQQPTPIISIDMNPQSLVDSAFRIAAREDRLRDMLLAIKRGAHVDAASDRGRTALMFAARNCSIPIARELIQLKADVNIRDHEGETAIEYATLESCLPVVKMILRIRGVDLYLKDQSGKTVLDYATDCASLDVDGPAAQILSLLKRSERRRK